MGSKIDLSDFAEAILTSWQHTSEIIVFVQESDDK